MVCDIAYSQKRPPQERLLKIALSISYDIKYVKLCCANYLEIRGGQSAPPHRFFGNEKQGRHSLKKAFTKGVKSNLIFDKVFCYSELTVKRMCLSAASARFPLFDTLPLPQV
ncbi:MAG: hypothetical protein C4520_20095 [Candidatus Abyssobacteria bacterium SURF_5]|uniref:Uncharacterized protein n=1 Tax=Abyssobacteria bacterium (strain SURF_5) TaxID=2093360 RepID=A0A3A4NJR7_ABYX5|nr:MAG: hypothetical protein C4520_20095 [Candidatus Abyssubacteria bacterium SURF_5]